MHQHFLYGETNSISRGLGLKNWVLTKGSIECGIFTFPIVKEVSDQAALMLNKSNYLL